MLNRLKIGSPTNTLKIEVSESPILNFLFNIYTRFMAYELPMTFELAVFNHIGIGERN